MGDDCRFSCLLLAASPFNVSSRYFFFKQIGFQIIFCIESDVICRYPILDVAILEY